MKPLIIFFDGPCVMCNWWVNKLCRWDKKDQLRFAQLKGKMASDFAKARNIKLDEIDTVIIWDQSYSYAMEAEATFMLFHRLGGVFWLLTVFSYLPKGFTNGIYRMVANNRYRWFGQTDHCPLPPEEYKHKFL